MEYESFPGRHFLADVYTVLWSTGSGYTIINPHGNTSVLDIFQQPIVHFPVKHNKIFLAYVNAQECLIKYVLYGNKIVENKIKDPWK
jgi:hypothetical protein